MGGVDKKKYKYLKKCSKNRGGIKKKLNLPPKLKTFLEKLRFNL